MSQTLPPPPVPGLPVQWQDWLTGSIVKGGSDEQLLATMRESGFDAYYARVAISIIRSMTERVQQSAATMLTDYQPDPIRIGDAPRRLVSDREVRIGFVLLNPNVALVEGLLSDQECEKLMSLAASRLKRSEVIVRATGDNEVSDARTSDGMYFQRGENAIVDRLEKRIADLTGIPVDHGEGVQILRYGPGTQYLPHHDYFDPKDAGTPTILKAGGQRVGTVVLYLNDVEAGGETVFPELELSVKPQRGTAVYFEYHNRSGGLDARCLHGGAPVVRGEKWIATKWLRERPNVLPPA
ncbi:MAG TPA: 2OG-Fe(II) oxygenase [Burkholderiaceae bacterium]|nr:2OG-Fe(II) oxygenase [Burkholderiaceae bacterium]